MGEKNMDKILVVQTKSVGLAIILTIFFGPIGLFYASVSGALFLILGIPLIIGIYFGVGLINVDYTIIFSSIVVLIVFLVFEWLISIIWSVVAVNNYNKNLIRKSENKNHIHTENSKPNQYNQTPEIRENRVNRRPDSDYMPKNSDKPKDIPTLEEWLKFPGRSENGYNLKFGISGNRKSETQININKRRK